MKFIKAEIDSQKLFLDKLSTQIKKSNVLAIYYELHKMFPDYCYGMETTNKDDSSDDNITQFKSLLYFIPSKKPVIFPPLALPEEGENIKQTLIFTSSFSISTVSKVCDAEQLIFLFRQDTITGKAILSLKDTNNGKIYNTDDHIVIKILPSQLKEEHQNLLNETKFKTWHELGDANISKLLDLTFIESLNKNISGGKFKNTMREDFKTKKLSRDDCIVMGKEGKAIGIAFPKLLTEKSNNDVIFGSSYYFGIIPKMRTKGYSNILFASCLDALIKKGANVYLEKINKNNIYAIKTIKSFDCTIYDTMMSINL